jgi:beta-glucosidase
MSAWIDGPTTHPLAGPAAVLEAWMMGQAGGGAVADILFGKVNPSGKLSETFPLKLADTPAYLNYPGDTGKVRYGEGIFIGYRYYDAKEMPVLFPFGYGLSYTTYAYSVPRLSAATFKDVDGVSVSVDVTNTGRLVGKETVQVYVHDRQSALKRPPKELKGFAKIELQPGETKTVTISLDFRAFAYYNPTYKQWVTENGEFDILVGASSTDIRGIATVTLQSTLDLPCLLNRESTVHEWLTDPRGQPVFDPVWQMMKAYMGEAFGDEDPGLIDLPLLVILRFQESALPMPALEIVDNLLAQVHDGQK